MNVKGKTLCFRILTVVFSILILLLGVALFGYAMYMRVDYWTNNYTNAHEELRIYFIVTYIFIGTGAVIILACIAGFYGAIRKDKIGLVIFLIFLPLILCALIGGGVYAYIYREDIENTIQNSNILVGIIQSDYGYDEAITQSFDYMQRELKCCGGVSFTDYKNSRWSEYTIQNPYRINKAPLTCCNDYWLYKDDPNEYRYCSMYLEDASQAGNPLPDVNSKIYKTGCGKALVMFFQDHITIAAVIAFCNVPLVFLATVFVSVLLFYLRKDHSPREEELVYEMARTQEKSMYPYRSSPYSSNY